MDRRIDIELKNQDKYIGYENQIAMVSKVYNSNSYCSMYQVTKVYRNLGDNLVQIKLKGYVDTLVHIFLNEQPGTFCL